MEIKGSVSFDRDVRRTFLNVTIFKNRNPKKEKTGLFIAVAVITTLTAGDVITSGFKAATMSVICAAVVWAVVFMYFCAYIAGRRLFSRFNGKKQDCVFADDKVTLLEQEENQSDTVSLGYSLMTEVTETSKYFFIYYAEMGASIVDKSTLSGGTVEELREKLLSEAKKYVFCQHL